MTQIYIKQNIHKHRTQNFRRSSPFGITPVEKAHKARTQELTMLYSVFTTFTIHDTQVLQMHQGKHV